MAELDRPIRAQIARIDRRILGYLERHGHSLHRHSLGVLFIWLGLLKPLGHETTTSLLAQTIYLGSPETMVLVLGWWEVAIGAAMLFRPLVRVSLFLLLVRIPGILLAFVLLPDVTFIAFPLVPTPEGQYLLKDLTLFFAAMAIGGTIRHEHG